MTKYSTVLVTASLATLLALFAPASAARADIFQWQFINPTNPSLGKQQSTTLAPDGAGANALPGTNLSNRNLTKAYLIGAQLAAHVYWEGVGDDYITSDLTGANLSQADLANAILIGAMLAGTNLSQANLSNATFDGYYQNYESDSTWHLGANLTGANLGQANLTGARFGTATLTNTDLSEANLTNASFNGATLTGANLTGTEVRGANFARTFLPYPTYIWAGGITLTQLYSTASYEAGDLTGIGLQSNNLSGGIFIGRNLTNADLSFATLTNADFNLANLTNADLSGANLTGANLSQSNLTYADVSNVTLTSADLTGAKVRGASFLGTGITAAQLYSTASYQTYDLSGIKLSGNHAGLNLASQNLNGADFQAVSLANANLSQAKLTGADLSVHYDPNFNGSVDLTGANLSQANLANADLSGFSFSVYDDVLGEVIVVVPGANLSGANLSGADARGANFQYATLSGANTSNLIQSNGRIAGLDLTSGASLVVRDYDGNPGASPPTGPLPIIVEQHLAMDATSALGLVFDADPWDSLISFAPGVPVALGGTLELTFAAGVDVAAQNGRTIDLFDWTGVTPTGAFTVESPYTWNLSKLYTTGEITLAALSALAGDFNGNGMVDAADYTVWRDGLGSTYTPADYDVWKAHFGESSGSGSAGASPSHAAVPEPSSFAILIAGAVVAVAGLVRRRTRSDPGA